MSAIKRVTAWERSRDLFMGRLDERWRVDRADVEEVIEAAEKAAVRCVLDMMLCADNMQWWFRVFAESCTREEALDKLSTKIIESWKEEEKTKA